MYVDDTGENHYLVLLFAGRDACLIQDLSSRHYPSLNLDLDIIFLSS